MSYLLVDTADNTIITKCKSAEDACQVLEQLQNEQPQRELDVVWLGERQGQLIGCSVTGGARPLGISEGLAFGRRPHRRRRRGMR